MFSKRSKKKYEVHDVVIDKPIYYKTGKDYHQLIAVFQYTIFYSVDGIMCAYTGLVDNKAKWDGSSIPKFAQWAIGKPLDPIWAMESLVHDHLCNIDFIGEVRDKAFRLLMKRNPKIVAKIGLKIGWKYTAVVQYREWKGGIFSKLTNWLGWK